MHQPNDADAEPAQDSALTNEMTKTNRIRMLFAPHIFTSMARKPMLSSGANALSQELEDLRFWATGSG